jgi:hypothetical protein
MIFPNNPNNGDEFEGYVYDSTNRSWSLKENSDDAFNRINHYGMQAISTIIGLAEALSVRAHVIQNGNTTLPTRGKISFVGFNITDDIINDRHVITVSVEGLKGDKGDKGDPGIGLKGDPGIPGTISSDPGNRITVGTDGGAYLGGSESSLLLSTDGANRLSLGTDGGLYLNDDIQGQEIFAVNGVLSLELNGRRYTHNLVSDVILNVTYSAVSPKLDAAVLHVFQPSSGLTYNVELPANSYKASWRYSVVNNYGNEILITAPLNNRISFSSQILEMV